MLGRKKGGGEKREKDEEGEGGESIEWKKKKKCERKKQRGRMGFRLMSYKGSFLAPTPQR